MAFVFEVCFGFGRRERPLDLERLELSSSSIFSSSSPKSIGAVVCLRGFGSAIFLVPLSFFFGTELVSLSVLSARGLFCPTVVDFGVFVVVLALLLVGAEEGPGDMLIAGRGSLQYFSARVIRSRTFVFSYFRISQSRLQAGYFFLQLAQVAFVGSSRLGQAVVACCSA